MNFPEVRSVRTGQQAGWPGGGLAGNSRDSEKLAPN